MGSCQLRRGQADNSQECHTTRKSCGGVSRFAIDDDAPPRSRISVHASFANLRNRDSDATGVTVSFNASTRQLCHSKGKRLPPVPLKTVALEPEQKGGVSRDNNRLAA